MEFEELEAFSPEVKFAAHRKWEDMINFMQSSFFPFLTPEDELSFSDAIQRTKELKESYRNKFLENDICKILDHLKLIDINKEAVEGCSKINDSPETRLGELTAVQKMVEIANDCLSWSLQPEDAKLMVETIKQMEEEKRVYREKIMQIESFTLFPSIQGI